MTKSNVTNLLDFCRTIGAPLLEVACKSSASPQDAAKTMADLLAKTASAGVDLARVLGLDDNSDSQRLASAALAAPVVAKIYEKDGKPPDSDALSNLAGQAEIIEQVSKGMLVGDDIPISEIKCKASAGVLYALYPIINCAVLNPMGKDPKDFLSDVVKRLMEKAKSLAKTLGGNADNAAEQLAALRCIVGVWAVCHGQAKDEKEFWEAFDTRAAMLQTLALTLFSDEKAPSSAGAAEPKVDLEAKQKSEPLPIRRSPAARKSPLAAPSDEGQGDVKTPEPDYYKEDSTKDESPKDSNPMSFFKKKKEE